MLPESNLWNTTQMSCSHLLRGWRYQGVVRRRWPSTSHFLFFCLNTRAYTLTGLHFIQWKGQYGPISSFPYKKRVTGGDSVWLVGGNIWHRLAAGLPQASCGRRCGLPPPVWLWWEWTVGSMWALWAPCTARLYTQAVFRMKAKGHGSNSWQVISRQLGRFAKI